MKYTVNTDKIHVFPLAKNRASDRAGRLFYEDNIANIIRQLVDKDAFIITRNPSLTFTVDDNVDSNSESTFYNISVSADTEMNIHGYFIRLLQNAVICQLELDPDVTNPEWDLYAYILIDDEAKEVQGQDDVETGKYTGVFFDAVTLPNDSYSHSEDTYSLHLCTIKSSVNAEHNRVFKVEYDSSSFVKFNPDSLDVSIKRIDGRH